jgi:hypothetical protein
VLPSSAEIAGIYPKESIGHLDDTWLHHAGFFARGLVLFIFPSGEKRFSLRWLVHLETNPALAVNDEINH